MALKELLVLLVCVLTDSASAQSCSTETVIAAIPFY